MTETPEIPNEVLEVVAAAHVARWAWTVRHELDHFEDLERLERYRHEGGDLTTRALLTAYDTTATTHWLILSLHHLALALELDPLPGELAGLTFPPTVRGEIERLRHIYEHWNEGWDRANGPGVGRSITEFREDHPELGPFGRYWSIEHGHTIAGVLNLEDVKPHLARVEDGIARFRGRFQDD